MYNGVINVYKEKGFTSHDVVAKMRGILHMKKIGHTGTLDPDATGVLPVCLGNATKLCDMLTDKTKTYNTVIQLGIVTDTQDTSGRIISSYNGVYPDKNTISKVINDFVGEYDQIPPMYSAIKVKGKKLYELAREGKEIDRASRRVCINSIEIEYIDEENHTVKMTVDCSKGTYIRTLCHDIGQKLNVGACMSQLERIRVSDFSVENAITLDVISELVEKGEINKHIVSVERIFKHLDAIVTKKETDRLVINGNKLLVKDVVLCSDNNMTNNMLVRVFDSSNRFLAIYKYDEQEEVFKPFKMFPVKEQLQ